MFFSWRFAWLSRAFLSLSLVFGIGSPPLFRSSIISMRQMGMNYMEIGEGSLWKDKLRIFLNKWFASEYNVRRYLNRFEEQQLIFSDGRMRSKTYYYTTFLINFGDEDRRLCWAGAFVSSSGKGVRSQYICLEKRGQSSPARRGRRWRCRCRRGKSACSRAFLRSSASVQARFLHRLRG